MSITVQELSVQEILAVGGQSTGPIVVATFTGNSPAVNNYVVTINWGDGSGPDPTAQIFLTGGDQSTSYFFTVVGNHQFQETFLDNNSNTLSTSVTVNSITATNTDNEKVGSLVVEAQLTPTSTIINTQAGVNYQDGNVSGILGTFFTPDAFFNPGSFVGVVAWGDGSNSNDLYVVSASNLLELNSPSGTYLIYSDGGHTYAQAGTYGVQVYLFKLPFNNDSKKPTIASFKKVSRDLEKSATWKKKAPLGVSVGDVNPSTDAENPNLESVVIISSMMIVGAPPITPGATVTLQTPMVNGNVALFSAPTGTLPSSLSATINYGDGTSGPGSIIDLGPGTVKGTENFGVNGYHQYSQSGTFPITTTITGGTGPNSTITILTTSMDFVSIATGPFEINVYPLIYRRNRRERKILANLIDQSMSNLADTDYTVHIHWGDGHKSHGHLRKTSDSQYTVEGEHKYHHSGQYQVSFHITQGTNEIRAMTTASVTR
jgi:hypothetical protein